MKANPIRGTDFGLKEFPNGSVKVYARGERTGKGLCVIDAKELAAFVIALAKTMPLLDRRDLIAALQEVSY